MPGTDGIILTDAGRTMLARAVAGERLTFTRGAAGDGELGTRKPESLTSLISEKKSLAIQSVRTSKSGTVECVMSVTNEGMASGFWLREYGLFAKCGSDIRETLYAYCNKGETPGYLEGASPSALVSYALTLTTIIDRAQNVTAYISSSNSYVTLTRLEARVEDLYADSEDTKGVWVYGKNSEKRFTPRSWEDFMLEIFGDSDISNITRRLEIAEGNIARSMILYDQIGWHLIDPDWSQEHSNYLTNNYSSMDRETDMYSSRVTGIITGDDTLDVEDAGGIYPGNWYVLASESTGKAERVQAESISIQDGKPRVILAGTVKEQYSRNDCVIYRSAYEKQAYTAGWTSTIIGHSEICTKPRWWGSPFRHARLEIRHQPLEDSEIEAYVAMRKPPMTVKSEICGITVRGRLNTFQLKHPDGIRPGTVQVWQDGSEIGDYDFNGEVGRVSFYPTANGVPVTVDYEYGWENEGWHKMELVNRRDFRTWTTDKVISEYRYSLPEYFGTAECATFKIDLMRQGGIVEKEQIGTGTGSIEAYELSKLCTGVMTVYAGSAQISSSLWKWNADIPKVLCVTAAKGSPVYATYKWQGENPGVFDFNAHLSI